MIRLISNIVREEDGSISINGDIGLLKFYGYSETEAADRYVAECEYKKRKKEMKGGYVYA